MKESILSPPPSARKRPVQAIATNVMLDEGVTSTLATLIYTWIVGGPAAAKANIFAIGIYVLLRSKAELSKPPLQSGIEKNSAAAPAEKIIECDAPQVRQADAKTWRGLPAKTWSKITEIVPPERLTLVVASGFQIANVFIIAHNSHLHHEDVVNKYTIQQATFAASNLFYAFSKPVGRFIAAVSSKPFRSPGLAAGSVCEKISLKIGQGLTHGATYWAIGLASVQRDNLVADGFFAVAAGMALGGKRVQDLSTLMLMAACAESATELFIRNAHHHDGDLQRAAFSMALNTVCAATVYCTQVFRGPYEALLVAKRKCAGLSPAQG